MHVQASLVAAHLNLHLRPLAGHKVYVALVFLWELLAQSEPGTIRIRNVLCRMVAARLVVGASIRGTQVEAFVFDSVFARVEIDTEGYADEAPRICAGIGARLSGQIDLDHTVLKFSLFQDHELNSIWGV